MKKYKRKFIENIKKKEFPMYLSRDSLTFQNPFAIDELNGKEVALPFNTGIRYNEKSYEKIKKKEKEIINEINDIREILYNYTLSKAIEIQKLMIEENEKL
jgi:hypothetical protein